MATLIKNGLVYDGTGGEPVKTDILIKGKEIAEIGRVPVKSAKVIIDASGKIVTPGFIDIGVRIDDYHILFSPKHQRGLLERGITTVIGGGYGESLAPFSHNCANRGLHFRCSHFANKDWESVSDFFAFLIKHKIPLNFGTFVGYHTVSNCVSKNIYGDPTESETKSILNILDKAMGAGVFGVSFDFKNLCGISVSKKMMKEVAEIVKKHSCVLSLTTHEKEKCADALRDAYSFSQKTGVSVEINHFCHEDGKSEKKKLFEILEKLEKKSSGTNVNFDVYSSEWEEEKFEHLIPKWGRGKNLDETLKIFRLATQRKRISDYLEKNIPDGVIIGELPPNFSFLRGKLLSDFAKNRECTKEEALIFLMQKSRLNGTCIFPKKTDKEVVEHLLLSPISLISSHLASADEDEKNFEPFSINKLKMDKVPFESIISKYTHSPAQKLNIKKRGIIKKKYFADISIFNKDGEAEHVFVNGALAYSEGKLGEINFGDIISKN